MLRWIVTFSLFLSLFCAGCDTDQKASDNIESIRTELCTQQNSTDTERQIITLADALQHNHALAPRRTVSCGNPTLLILRQLKIMEKHLQTHGLLWLNQLHRLSQHRNQTLQNLLSCLVFCEGQHLLTLRKLVL